MAASQSRILQKAFRGLRNRLNKIYPDYLGDKYECPLCNAKLANFLPLPTYYFSELQKNQHIHSIFQLETLNIESYACPVCSCSDRDRLYYLYIRKALQTIDKSRKLRLLEIAPAPQLRKTLQQDERLEYRCGDLFMLDVDDKIDITKMTVYANESFDCFVCSHVLEHVEDDRQAMRELYRILKRGGWGIAMVPINLGLDDNFEKPDVTDAGERWKYFGQDDHVRMYSKQGFVSRLTEAGFNVEQLGENFFGRETFEKHGIHPRSVLYVVKKR